MHTRAEELLAVHQPERGSLNPNFNNPRVFIAFSPKPLELAKPQFRHKKR
jgi:hypothetical protein